MHAYLTILSSIWFYIIYIIVIIGVVITRRDEVRLIFVPAFLYLTYLYLLSLSYAHGISAERVIVAFIISILNTLPVVIGTFIALGILVQGTLALNLIALVVASLITLGIVTMLRQQEKRAEALYED